MVRCPFPRQVEFKAKITAVKSGKLRSAGLWNGDCWLEKEHFWGSFWHHFDVILGSLGIILGPLGTIVGQLGTALLHMGSKYAI